MSPAAKKISDEYQALLMSLSDVLGVVVDDENHAQVRKKLESVVKENGFGSLNELASAMREEASDDLLSSIVQAITEHDAVWFGYPEINSILTGYVLPGVNKGGKKQFRIWVVGCGQGQIVYSIAMVLEEFRQNHDMNCNFEIVATDMSTAVVEKASKGLYEADALTSLPVPYKQKYLDAKNGQWEIDKSLKKAIKFKACDLLKPFLKLGHFDLIICPDVFIYYANEVKREILDEFAELLDPSGMLIVGVNEPIKPFSDKFDLVDHASGVFYRQIPG